MTLTLEDLEQRKEKLRHEIMERECILAAIEVPTELKEIGYWQGRNTRLVQWAIRQLQGEFTIRDIHALLGKEGAPMQAPETSVVLSRLKDRKAIIESRPGSGRKPAVFLHPSTAGAEKLDAAA